MMRRLWPHILAVISVILFMWLASYVREAAAQIAERTLVIPWGQYLLALGLWMPVGFALGLPSVLSSGASIGKLRIQWRVLVLYLLSGVVLAPGDPSIPGDRNGWSARVAPAWRRYDGELADRLRACPVALPCEFD